MSYKKRGQAGWNDKKTAKKLSKSKERMYSKELIISENKELAQGDDFRYTYPAKKVLTPEQKATKEIEYWEKSLEFWTRPSVRMCLDSDYHYGIISRAKSKIKALKEKKEVK